jgi:hypothetical protein
MNITARGARSKRNSCGRQLQGLAACLQLAEVRLCQLGCVGLAGPGGRQSPRRALQAGGSKQAEGEGGGMGRRVDGHQPGLPLQFCCTQLPS